MVRGDEPGPGQSVTQGTVVSTGHTQQHGRSGWHDYYLPTASFVVDGRTYRVSYGGSPSRTETPVGATVTVIYDLDDPADARIPLDERDRATFLPFLGLGTALTVWSYAAHVRPGVRLSRAARPGT
ncbi:DUF3592 domain-containing protein [Cellulomonas sp.]|uniref:DUF3592 domain-containing protein n=1 Tax=Cellulomonas sp. TaxID=40001 RepID=UPI003BA9A4A7